MATRFMAPADGDLVSCVEYLWECGEIVGALEMLRFIERPTRFPELLALWDAEVEHNNDVQGELQDERRATL